MSEIRDAAESELKVVSEKPGFLILGLVSGSGIKGASGSFGAESMGSVVLSASGGIPGTTSNFLAWMCLRNFSNPLPVLSSLIRTSNGLCGPASSRSSDKLAAAENKLAPAFSAAATHAAIYASTLSSEMTGSSSICAGWRFFAGSKEVLVLSEDDKSSFALLYRLRQAL